MRGLGVSGRGRQDVLEGQAEAPLDIYRSVTLLFRAGLPLRVEAC